MYNKIMVISCMYGVNSASGVAQTKRHTNESTCWHAWIKSYL